MVVFIPFTAAGDVVEANIAQLKNYCIGEIREVITPSPDRVEPGCPYFQPVADASISTYRIRSS